MTPAFHSTRHAICFGLTLLFLLALPVALRSIGGAPIEEAYRGISERAGSFAQMRREIFEEREPADLLFCGSSLLRSGVDAELAARELGKALGKPASVAVLPMSWQGPDLNYYVARDFIEHRKAKMLVMAAPALVHRSSQPHVQLFRVVRFGDHPGALEGLGPRSQIATYAEFVLGAPRQALNLLRRNRVEPAPRSRIEKGSRLGYLGAPFVERTVKAPAVAAKDCYELDGSRAAFRFDAPDLNPYQLHYLRKTAELARQHGVLLVLLHMPSPSERGLDYVPWQRNAAALAGPNVALAGIASAAMFRGAPQDQYFDFFQDEHLNANGKELFTREFMPALIELYDRTR
jgi:hypothetical protein